MVYAHDIRGKVGQKSDYHCGFHVQSEPISSLIIVNRLSPLSKASEIKMTVVLSYIAIRHTYTSGDAADISFQNKI